MKICTIIGARPQFIKAAALSRALKKYPSIHELIIHTGQHHDTQMSDIFFNEMDIPNPHYMLEVAGLSHGAMTGRMLEKIEEILIIEKPDWVLVYGDTNSTLAGALAASKLHIPLAHVEAGLRSFNMKMPEEINRILTDKISTLLFCPSDAAVINLEKENVSKGVFRTGDIMADALFYYRTQADFRAKLFKEKPEGKYILATIHRAENTDDPKRLRSIIAALEILSLSNPVYLPLHPRTKNKLKELGISPNLNLLDPLGYYDMLQLLGNCTLVMTDSGGLQKEAYLCEKPCITFRDETEWVELIECGVNKLVGTNTENILDSAKNFLKDSPVYPASLYGDGNAADQIIKAIMSFKV